MDEPDQGLSPIPIARDRLSVEELRARIESLKAEIEACEIELAKKQAHLNAADELFGKNG